MALISRWDQVVEALNRYNKLRRIQPLLAAMHGLVATLRNDSRLADVEPGLSHVSLTLRLPNHKRYVMVGMDHITMESGEEEVRNFAISFVDPPLEFSDTKLAPPTEAVTTILDYLERLRH